MIIRDKSGNFDERQAFQLTESGVSGKLKNNVGRRFDAVGYILYEDDDRKTGENREMLIIVTDDGDSLATSSATVIRTFVKMLDCFALPIKDIEVAKATNERTGREFLNLKLL